MHQTKTDFDQHMLQTVNKILYTQASHDVYRDVMTVYRAGNAPDLAFLDQMPYENMRKWIDKAIADYMHLYESNPDEYPITGPVEVIRRIRAYRKEQRENKKTSTPKA